MSESLSRCPLIFQPVHSPLFMAMNDPVLHRFISYLATKKAEQEAEPGKHLRIELSQDFIASVRESFRQNILDGERHLHVLSHLLSSLFLDAEFELHSNVIGVLPGDEDRPFLIRERIARETLFNSMDIDLGNQMLDNFRYRRDADWVPLELSANFIEYLPQKRTLAGVNRLTSRVKAEEELWNKVTDEIFQIDQLVTRDKHLRHYSKYVKDIFGIKIVCDDVPTCLKVHDAVRDLTVAGPHWDSLAGLDFVPMPSSGRKPTDTLLAFIETKDYLTGPSEQMKKTGWRAIKSVTKWQDRLFEIQVQPLANYYLELDHMAGPSHQSFKLQRDAMRDEVASHIPLYGFYRDLLKMLFMESDISFESANASVVIT